MPIWLQVGLAIALAGVFGGIGGALMGGEFVSVKKDQNGNPILDQDGKKTVVTDRWALRKSVFLGFLAAWVVPLFLVMATPGQEGGIINELMKSTCSKEVTAVKSTVAELQLSDDALKEVKKAINGLETAAGFCTSFHEWWSNLLILVGFCIVAALVAQRFLGSIAEKLLKDAKETAEIAEAKAEEAMTEIGTTKQAAVDAEKKAEEAMKEIGTTKQAAVDAEMKAQKAEERVQLAEKKLQQAEEMAELAARRADAAQSLGPGRELEEDALIVFKAFADLESLPAALDDIAQKANLTNDDVLEQLEELRGAGLVVHDVDEAKWDLSNWGPSRLRDEIDLSQDDRDILKSLRLQQQSDARPKPEALAAHIPHSDLENVRRGLMRLERLGLVTSGSGTMDGWRIRSGGVNILEDLG